MTMTPSSRLQTSTVTMTPISQIGDGQVQNPTGAAAERDALTESSADPGCGATPTPQKSSTTPTTSTGEVSPDTALPSTTSTNSTTSTSQAPTPSQTGSVEVSSLVSCLTNSTLRLTLSNGTLLDARNRTGYIASNYQFQFDGPPQSGAIYTSGWRVCDADDGSPTLALGGNTTFYQCLSGKFYNLYTINWAAQCSPVQLKVTGLVQCAS